MKKFHYLNILPPTFLLAVTALLSRLMGLFRDHLLAGAFGATAGDGIYNLDAYYAAFRVPDMLYNLLIFGAISAAFIPLFTQHRKLNQNTEAWKFASAMLHLMLVVILFVSGIAYIFAPQLANVVAGGFSDEAFSLTVRLMRIMLISPIIFTFTSIVVSIQDSFKEFFFRAVAPLFYNLGIILGILFFGSKFGVVGVTWGVIFGAFLQLIIQLPALKRVGYHHFWIFGVNRPDVRQAFKLILPRFIGLALNHLGLIGNTLIASFLMTGSITVFYLADNLQALPLGIIAISFAITSFATLSELAMEADIKLFADEIRRISHQILFLVIPASFGIFALRADIISFLFVSGKFSEADANLTSAVLGFMLFSLFAQSLIPIFARGFYAYHNTKVPVFAAFSGVICNISLSLILSIYFNFGIIGIAMAFSVGAIVNFLILYFGMSKKLKCRVLDWMNVFKMFVASSFMMLAVVLVRNFVFFIGSFAEKAIVLILYAATGVGVYFGLAFLFKIPELKMIKKQVKRIG